MQDQMTVSVLFDIDSLPVMSVKHNELSVTAGRFAREGIGEICNGKLDRRVHE